MWCVSRVFEHMFDWWSCDHLSRPLALWSQGARTFNALRGHLHSTDLAKPNEAISCAQLEKLRGDATYCPGSSYNLAPSTISTVKHPFILALDKLQVLATKCLQHRVRHDLPSSVSCGLWVECLNTCSIGGAVSPFYQSILIWNTCSSHITCHK